MLMKTILMSALQGREEGFNDYIDRLQEIVNENEVHSSLPPVLHQTSAADGRMHTTIQFTVTKDHSKKQKNITQGR